MTFNFLKLTLKHGIDRLHILFIFLKTFKHTYLPFPEEKQQNYLSWETDQFKSNVMQFFVYLFFTNDFYMQKGFGIDYCILEVDWKEENKHFEKQLQSTKTKCIYISIFEKIHKSVLTMSKPCKSVHYYCNWLLKFFERNSEQYL